jgi:hypothetical protein
MKRILVALAASALLCSVSHAGWGWNKNAFHSAKSALVQQTVTGSSYCFDAGFEFSAFGSGFLTDDGSGDDAIGGGVALAYYFGHNLGVEASYSLYGSDVAEHVGTFNLIYRFPLGGKCCSTIAPYIFGGPGVASVGNSEFLWNAGAGIDFRLESWGCVGLFGDYSYNWVKDGAFPDFNLVRVGVRVPF